MNEKLSLWDRIFNRYKTVIIEEGTELSSISINGQIQPNSEHIRHFVKYKKIDRVTGSEEIIVKYPFE